MPESDFDAEILADKTIDMVSVSAGQVIGFWARTYSLDLIKALAFRIRQRGAFWSCQSPPGCDIGHRQPA